MDLQSKKQDKKCPILLIWNQLVLGDLPVWLINPSKKCLFDKLSLAVVVAYGVAKNPHIFITRENQHIQEINIHFDATLKNFGHMVFSENQKKKIYDSTHKKYLVGLDLIIKMPFLK